MNFCQRWRLVGFEQDTPAKDERWRVLSKGPGAALTTKHYKGIRAILNSAWWLTALGFPEDVACLHRKWPIWCRPV